MKRALLGSLLWLTACEAPGVFATADRRQHETSGRIEGNVVVTGKARGNAVVLLYDAAKPPPPVGTGRPLTFTTVKGSDLFGGATDNGPFTAPFTFSLVKPGNYLVRGLIDANADFNPWYGVTADANAGDVGGAAVDPNTRAPRIVKVVEVALDVGVSFSDAALVPVDRPAFQVVSTSQSVTVMAGAAPVAVELAPQPLNQAPVFEKAPVFLAQLGDDDHDGVPDDKNGDGAPDVVWPRVIVRKIADDGDLTDDDFGDYTHVSATLQRVDPDGVPDTVVLAAGIDPTEIFSALTDVNGAPLPAPVPVAKLRVVIRPLALDVTNPALPVPLISPPPGKYAIILIAPTGQTWRVPNELAPTLAAVNGLPSVNSQGFVVQVP